MFIFTSKLIYISDVEDYQVNETAATVVMSSEGGKTQSFTKAAPNERKLGTEGQRGEGWPSTWRWRRGVSQGQERRKKNRRARRRPPA